MLCGGEALLALPPTAAIHTSLITHAITAIRIWLQGRHQVLQHRLFQMESSNSLSALLLTLIKANED